MLEGEKQHLATFNQLLKDRSLSPSKLLPLWRVLGYSAGMISALMGKKTAMTCTVAVEEVIDEHYKKQIDQLSDSENDLKETLSQFRDDEIHHKDIALSHKAKEAFAYPLLRQIFRIGSKISIKIAQKI
jgi:3-demethoxyubiquinol 3-hydroxylase